MRGCFPEEDSQIRSMLLKTCLTPLAIEEMQIKTSIKGQVCSSVVGSCLACARPWAPTPAFQNKKKTAECWWLRPVIIGTQEAAIRRITIQSQPGQIAGEDLSQKKKPNTKEEWWSVSRCRLEFKPQYCKKKRIILYSWLPLATLKT
jgi:hypothetical protein